MLAVTNGQWVSSLLPSAYRQLAALGLQLSFDDGPLPRVPARAATLTVAGSFIDEGAPFPVRQLAFAASQQLKPKKLAVATVFSREVASASQPNVEAVLRDEIVADTSVAVDSVLLSATAANTAAPAGLRSGVAGLTATASGTTNERMVADVRQLLAAIAPAASPVLIVNSQQALTIASVYQSESPALIVSPNVPAGTVTAVDAGAFVTASRLPSFQISTDPVIPPGGHEPVAYRHRRAGFGRCGRAVSVDVPDRQHGLENDLADRLAASQEWRRRVAERRDVVSAMSDERERREAVRIESIRLLAEAEERDREREERAEREARRIEALLDAPLPPPDWRGFRGVAGMSPTEYEAWHAAGRPQLGPVKAAPEPPPPPPPAAPVKPAGPRLTKGLFEALGDATARLISRAIAAERARTAEELASLRFELERLRGELGQLRAAREAEPPALAAPRGNGLARDAH